MLTSKAGLARACAAIALLLLPVVTLHAEVLIRWDQNAIPSPASLGIATVVVPAGNTAALRSAVEQGYRVFVEVEPAALARFVPPAGGITGVVVRGPASPQQLTALAQRLKAGTRIITL